MAAESTAVVVSLSIGTPLSHHTNSEIRLQYCKLNTADRSSSGS